MAASSGKPLKALLAAASSTATVATATSTDPTLPAPNTASASWASTVCWVKSSQARGRPLRSHASRATVTPLTTARASTPPNSRTVIAPTPTRVSAALRPLGRRMAGTPLAMASTPASAAPPPAKERSTTRASATAVRSVERSTSKPALAATGLSPPAQRTRPVDHEHADDDDEAVDRQHRRPAGLVAPAQVDHHDEHHGPDRERDPPRGQPRQDGDEVVDGGGRAHGDGQRVVHEQRGRGDQPGPRAPGCARPPRTTRRRRGRPAPAGRRRRRPRPRRRTPRAPPTATAPAPPPRPGRG